jgi:hypothetical protein
MSLKFWRTQNSLLWLIFVSQSFEKFLLKISLFIQQVVIRGQNLSQPLVEEHLRLFIELSSHALPYFKIVKRAHVKFLTRLILDNTDCTVV